MIAFTNSEKLAEIERELGQRHHVYNRLIAGGKLSRSKAERQIAVLHAVAEDYRERVRQGPLFERSPP